MAVRLPEISVSEHLGIQASAKPLWCSAEHYQSWYQEYPEGIYYPVYLKIWQLWGEKYISTTHLADGKCVAIGQPWQRPPPSPRPVAVVNPTVEPGADVPARPTTLAEIQQAQDETLRELLEALETTLRPVPLPGDEVTPTPDPIQPSTRAERATRVRFADLDLADMSIIDAWEGSPAPFIVEEEPEIIGEVVTISTDDALVPIDDVLDIHAPDDDELLYTDL
ncbi:uncharacterized protein LOC129348266 [Amphiprion ocellaris]|uniref:uncharacterized protein LOC129348266 n=1 Tax=Amphiprion ocellaris TaxID=80972 RepID=UPI0024114A85|nr:uncharacterized protein LOC129348266 [Amphiprion ocellaris]